MITLLSGCGTNDNGFSARQKAEQVFASPYIAECSAKILSNKTENEYLYTCEKTADGDTVLDYVSIRLTLSGDSAVIENGADNIQTAVTDNELWLVPESYFNAYLKDGIFTETEDGYQCKADADINIYRKKIEIELDKKCIPVKMTLSNENGEETIEINVKKFIQK